MDTIIKNSVLDIVSSKNVIIFDVDLTLFDTRKAMKKCYESAFKKVDKVYEGDIEMLCKEGLRDTFNRTGLDENKFELFEHAFVEKSKECMVNDSEIYSDVIHVLNVLKKCEKRMAIVTGKAKKSVTKLLEKESIQEFFEVIVAYEDYEKEKPEPDSILMCLEKLNIVDKTEVLYVGDSHNDYIASQKAGIDVVIKNDMSNIECEYCISNLIDLVCDINMYLSYIIKSENNLFDYTNKEELIENWCKDNQYKQLESTKLFQKDIALDESAKMHVFDNNCVILTRKYKNIYGLNADAIISWKNEQFDKARDGKDEWISELLQKYNEIFNSIKRKGKEGIKESKIQYSLISYRVLIIGNEDIKNEFEENCKDFISKLLLKHRVKFDEKRTKEKLEDNNVKIKELNEENTFYSIWGARLIIGCKQNEKTSELWGEYILSEMRIQYAWQLISNETKKLDGLMQTKQSDIVDIMDNIYNVLLAEADFNYVNASISHRTEIEIVNTLREVSNLDKMIEYYKEKVSLLERRMRTISEERENANANMLNMILWILTMVSSFSAVLQIVQIFMGKGHDKVVTISYGIIALCVFIGFVVFAKIRKRK